MQLQSIKNTSYSSYNPNEQKPLVYSAIDDPFASLKKQSEEEYKDAKAVLDPKITTWQKRLKVYNNQRRADDAVGDTLLFTTMQTVLASLYDDQLMSEWEGTNDGDAEVEEALTHLAKYDHRKMHKDVLDYFWDWDTCFFGHSIVYMTDWDSKKKIPIPDLQNPMLFYRDKNAVMINGYPWSGRNACGYFGRWIELSKAEMRAHPEYINIDAVRPNKERSEDISKAKQSYSDAQGLSFDDRQAEGENHKYPLLEWCTHHNGKKVLVTFANDFKTVVRYHVFKTKEGGKGDFVPAKKWPVVDRLMYPMSHSWDGTSVPDIIEDKQRMRAVMKNLSIKHAKADIYPMYAYDKGRIDNETDLRFDFNKFIGINGLGGAAVGNAIAPLQKAQMNVALHQYIMQDLAQDAEKASATPQMQQGNLNDQKRLATELNMVDRNVGTRYSLTARVFGWSEADFWRQWYRGYKDNASDLIFEKILRIDSPYGARFRKFTKENIICDEDPDVSIVSKYVREQERLKLKNDFAGYLSYIAQIPGSNMRFGVKKLGKLMSIEKDDMDRLIPPTVDERIAERENEMLNANKPVLVNAQDNHFEHLETHARAADTPSAYAHKAAHERALEMYKANPELFPQMQQAQQQQQQAATSQPASSTPGTGSNHVNPPAGQLAATQQAN